MILELKKILYFQLKLKTNMLKLWIPINILVLSLMTNLIGTLMLLKLILKCPRGCSFWESLILSILIQRFYIYFTLVSLKVFCFFCFQAWGGKCKVEHMNYFQSIIKKCLRICNVEIYSPFYLLDKITELKFKRILNDNSHPLYNQIIFSKRREGRLLSITTKTERHRKSFLPRAVRSVHKPT